MYNGRPYTAPPELNPFTKNQIHFSREMGIPFEVEGHSSPPMHGPDQLEPGMTTEYVVKLFAPFRFDDISGIKEEASECGVDGDLDDFARFMTLNASLLYRIQHLDRNVPFAYRCKRIPTVIMVEAVLSKVKHRSSL